MPTIIVERAFNLILNPGDKPQPYAVGVHEVSQEVADHWYTKEHLAASGEALATKARAEADAAFHRADAAVKEYERLEDAARESELAAGLEPSEPAHLRLRQREEPSEGDDDLADDTVAGGEGNDSITATDAASDTLQGGAGDDTVTASAAADTPQGGAGNDSLSAGSGGDSVAGGQGEDKVTTTTAPPPAKASAKK